MRFVIYGVLGMVLLAVFGVVGYVVYNSVLQAQRAAKGEPNEPAPGMSGGPGNHPLAMPLRCVNRVERRAAESRARYASWVDLEAGPSCQEQHAARGLHALHDDGPQLCREAAQWARVSAPAELADALDALATSSDPLLQLTREAQAYYGDKKFAADDCARGKAMHPDLLAAYAAVERGAATVRAAMRDFATASNDLLRARVRKAHGHVSTQLKMLDALDELDAIAALYADGALDDGELAALDHHADKLLILNAGLGAALKKSEKASKNKKKADKNAAILSRSEAAFIEQVDKLAKLLRRNSVRRNNGRDPDTAERNAFERETRAALRRARNLDFQPPPVLLYAD